MNSQSRAIEDILRREEIPYKIIGGLKFYERKEIKDAIEKGNGKERAGKAYLTSGIASMIFWVVMPVVITLLITLISFILPLLMMIPIMIAGAN